MYLTPILGQKELLQSHRGKFICIFGRVKIFLATVDPTCEFSSVWQWQRYFVRFSLTLLFMLWDISQAIPQCQAIHSCTEHGLKDFIKESAPVWVYLVNGLHWVLLHNPMPFLWGFWWCNVWEIRFILCKQRKKGTTNRTIPLNWVGPSC